VKGSDKGWGTLVKLPHKCLRLLKNELHRVVGEIRRIALFLENTPHKHTHFRASALARPQTVELQGQAPTTSNVTFTLFRVACE
jgi:hypothetical protein